MMIQSRFSRRRGGKLIPLNMLHPLQAGGRIGVDGDVKTDATRQGLQDIGVLSGGVFDPTKLQTVQDDFLVTSPGGAGQIPLSQARDFNNPDIRQEFEQARTGDRNAPFFGQNKSLARDTYEKFIIGQATDRRKDLLNSARQPENFATDLLRTSDSDFFNERTAQELNDLEDPTALRDADPLFQGRVEQLEQDNPGFFNQNGFRGGGSFHNRPVKFKRKHGGRIKATTYKHGGRTKATTY